MQNTASVLPVASMSFGKKALKFVNVGVDMFWLYSFHESNYTRFLTALTNELDVMAELRVKPNFLQFMDQAKNTAISKFNETNVHYRNATRHHNKMPNDIYFAKSTFDIYTFTLFLALFMFALMILLRTIFGLIKHKNRVFNFIY